MPQGQRLPTLVAIALWAMAPAGGCNKDERPPAPSTQSNGQKSPSGSVAPPAPARASPASALPELVGKEAQCRGEACARLGIVQARAKRRPKAMALFLRGCRTGGPISCAMAAMGYEKGKGVAKNAPRAEKLYKRSCAKGYLKGCYNLALMLGRGAPGVPLDTRRAEKLLEKACGGGDVRACGSLGAWLVDHGKRSRGLLLLKRSCQGGYPMACRELEKAGR